MRCNLWRQTGLGAGSPNTRWATPPRRYASNPLTAVFRGGNIPILIRGLIGWVPAGRRSMTGRSTGAGGIGSDAMALRRVPAVGPGSRPFFSGGWRDSRAGPVCSDPTAKRDQAAPGLRVKEVQRKREARRVRSGVDSKADNNVASFLDTTASANRH